MAPNLTDPRLRAILQVLAAAALFGASAPLAKALLASVSPLALAALLYLGSGMGTLAVLGLRRLPLSAGGAATAEAPLARRDVPWLAGAILAGGVAAPIALLFGLAATPAATAALLLNFEVVATTLIAALAFREPIGRRIWLAVAVTTLGSALLSLRGDGSWGVSLGAVGVLGACALWGLDNNLTRRISGKDPLAIVAIKGLSAGLFSLLLALSLGAPLPAARIAGEALLLGFASYGLSIALFIRGLRELGAARTGILFGTAPFLGAALSIVILKETPGAPLLISLPLFAGGTILLSRERHGHRHDHDELVHDHRHAHDDEHHAHPHAPGVPLNGRHHSHPHRHEPMTHAHAHAPDLHHDHGHAPRKPEDPEASPRAGGAEPQTRESERREDRR